MHVPLEEAVEISSALHLALCAAEVCAACQAEHISLILVLFSYVDIAQWHEAPAAVLLDHLPQAAHKVDTFQHKAYCNNSDMYEPRENQVTP
jgi:hypothetical protein